MHTLLRHVADRDPIMSRNHMVHLHIHSGAVNGYGCDQQNAVFVTVTGLPIGILKLVLAKLDSFVVLTTCSYA